VIGGLLASTVAALIILPLVFCVGSGKDFYLHLVSLDPRNRESKYFVLPKNLFNEHINTLNMNTNHQNYQIIVITFIIHFA